MKKLLLLVLTLTFISGNVVLAAGNGEQPSDGTDCTKISGETSGSTTTTTPPPSNDATASGDED